MARLASRARTRELAAVRREPLQQAQRVVRGLLLVGVVRHEQAPLAEQDLDASGERTAAISGRRSTTSWVV